MQIPPAAAPVAIPRALFVFSVLYGGMVCIAGVLGVKQVALGPLAVEAGIFAFLILVALSSAIAELFGQKVATSLVRLGFVPLLVSAALIQIVVALPHDPGMYPPAIDAFPVVVGQSARMMIAGLISYGISQTLNVLIFSKLSRGEGRLVWLRGIIASVISQIIDTLLFISISFYGERPILGLMAGQMATKVILSIVLMPLMITGLVALGRRLDRKAF
ncbi:queuosine precursor transporter [Sphingomonadaceae bacterium OTU29MARTA1]|nr:queuosine precursor transporter [Sphingomonadaceae bacterium OTU29LAMAA1]USU07331.1 queuosine precursor transporter [Sphingomonadaceae bacterium OTU29MARTA1]USU10827.1 queuosine precursor transporter [Sphingomonadaceae bacterium OTU29THOMA1]